VYKHVKHKLKITYSALKTSSIEIIGSAKDRVRKSIISKINKAFEFFKIQSKATF